MSFKELLMNAQNRNQSMLAVGLAPSLDRMPLPLQKYDEPFLPFGKNVIDATSGLVCAYVFHLASYLALGAAGAVALERTIAYVPTGVLKILHGPFVTPDYVDAAFEAAFGADAVTLSAAVDLKDIAPYVHHFHHGVFVEAPPGFNGQPLMRLNEDYPGQVGIYRREGATYNLISLFFEPFPDLDWYWGDRITPSLGEDYRNAVGSAVTALRRKPPVL